MAAIVYTDIARDGALTGVDADADGGFAREAAACRSSPRAASPSLADIAALKARESDGIAGVDLRPRAL